MYLRSTEWHEAAKAFLLALGVSGLLAWPIYRILIALKSRQTVSQYLGETHQAKQGTPTMGGLIILAGLIVALVVSRGAWPAAFVFGFALIGFIDDFAVPRLLKGKRGLGWMPKLAMELVVVFVLFVLTGSRLPVSEAAGLAFMVLFVANAYNFADGLDGLAGGLALLIAPVFSIMAFQTQGPAMAALIGATIPFLVLNSPPAKVFMGDVGSLAVGSLFGLFAWEIWVDRLPKFYSGPGEPPLVSPYLWADRAAIIVLGLVMIAELVPVPLQILSVKLRKGKRLFPRTPIHHTFEHWGWPESKITWSFLLVQLVCSALAVSIMVLARAGGIK